MKTTGSNFEEPPVDGRYTDTVCEKLDEKSYLIDGKPINLPLVVNDASMMMNAFLVDSKAAQAMIADSGFRVVELFPGKAIVQLLCVDYRVNPLGNYNEGAIIFPVLTPDEKKPLPFFGTLKRLANNSLGNYVYRMPVDQEFTTHGGRFIWGFPKWPSQIDFDFGEHLASGCFIDEGELIYSIWAKTGGSTEIKEQRAASLAIRGGHAWKTYGTSSGSGMTFSLGGKMPEIGDKHPLALELRSLGLPKKPVFTVTMKNTQMVFGGPEVAAIGEPFIEGY
ncbi:MAG: acetoacetate decarboxylase family protein [Proteobacteria bacterium]|nr:acetoacetate decarboxylase family protein [Pseudomonadota bacterium]